jgi:hypothetical protein
MVSNAFKSMQEIANAPFGGINGMTKEAYARELRLLEEAAQKHDNDTEPFKLSKTETDELLSRQ